MAPEDAHVAAHLLGLVRKELVRPNASAIAGNDAFRFRHLLIRDAAYDALPKSLRAQLHERFADWIDEHGADLVEREEILGYHLGQAALYRAELGTSAPELAARATSHLGVAGLEALERGDNHAAKNLLDRAVLLAADDPAARARLLPPLAEAAYSIGDLEGSERHLEEAVALARTGDKSTALRARVIAHHFHAHTGSVQLREHLDELDRLIEEIEAAGDDELLARGLQTRGWLRLWIGRADAGVADFVHALELAEATGSGRFRRELASAVSAGMRWGSTPLRELELFFDSEAARNAGSGGRLGSDLFMLRPHAMAARGDFAAARAEYLERVEELRERGENFSIHRIALNLAGVELLAGELPTAERILDDAWRELESAGESGFRSSIGAMLAETLARLGRPDEAETIVRESETLMADDDFHALALVHRARARIALARDDHDEAARHARAALGVLEQTDWLEDRAEAQFALGEALAAGGSRAMAAVAFRAAGELADAKGALVLAERARAALHLVA
jgi:tetratricopeptide (TPR) repeat protein